jgi:cation:H+ antiporter
VGTLLLAASTSLPELAVSAAAVRMGSIDMAVGNLLGSNVFNILILALDDVFYTKGVLLADASPVHLVSVLCTLMMSAVLTVGLQFHPVGKRFLLAWDALVILLIYAGNVLLLYRLGS